jgi:hypothetical protein
MLRYVRASFAVLLCILAVTACSKSGSGLAGRYKITAHTESTEMGKCDGATKPSTDTATVLSLEDQAFFGATLVQLHGCKDENDTACHESIGLGALFGLGELSDGSWGSDSASGATGTAAACTFGYSGVRLTTDGDQITIVAEHREGTEAVTVCSLDKDSNLTTEGASLPCQDRERLTATRLK